jgi:hypothetical protein
MRAVKAAKATHRCFGRLLHRCFVGNIDMDGECFPSRFLRYLRRAFNVDVGGADARAFCGEALDSGSANSGRAAEHDDTAVFETIVGHEDPLEKPVV